MKFVHLNNKIKTVFLILVCLVFSYSCIKPYACECTYVQTNPQQKSHILVYSTKQNKQKACEKNNQDSTVVCNVKD